MTRQGKTSARFHHLVPVAEDARHAGLRGGDLDALRGEMVREGRELLARGSVRLKLSRDA